MQTRSRGLIVSIDATIAEPNISATKVQAEDSGDSDKRAAHPPLMSSMPKATKNKKRKAEEFNFEEFSEFVLTMAKKEDKKTLYTAEYKKVQDHLLQSLTYYKHGMEGTLPSAWKHALEMKSLLESDEYATYLREKERFQKVEPENMEKWFKQAFKPIHVHVTDQKEVEEQEIKPAKKKSRNK